MAAIGSEAANSHLRPRSGQSHYLYADLISWLGLASWGILENVVTVQHGIEHAEQAWLGKGISKTSSENGNGLASTLWVPSVK